MIDGDVGSVLQYLRFRVEAIARQLPDRDLLQRFVEQHDEAAFRTLLRRHGPMVLRVCRGVLRDGHDAEDAFQATFLVLARKAPSVAWHRSIGSWLCAAAHRLASEARRRAHRRRAHEARVLRAGPADPLSEITGRELLAALDSELVRLPEKYRAPLVLCCLEGNSGEAAAQQLGCSLSTLRRRLGSGRELLRSRLARRGLTISSVALSAALSMESAALAAISTVLAGSTVRTVSRFATGEPIIGGAIPDRSRAHWVRTVRCLFAFRPKLTMILVLAAGILSVSAGTLALLAMAKPPESKRDNASAASPDLAVPARDEQRGKDSPGDPLPLGAVARLGTSRLRGRWCHFLPDGRRLERSKADGSLQISEVLTGRPLAVIHGSDVPGSKAIAGTTIGFSRDGKYLAAVCWQGRCGIWETATGRLVRWLESGQFISMAACVFSPDDKLLAVGGSRADNKFDKIEVGVYEVSSGRQLLVAPGSRCAFAPDGQSLITWNDYGGSSTQTARRVAVPSGKVLLTFSYVERRADMAPPSDGVWFFEVLADHSVRVWEVSTGKVKYTFPGPGANEKQATYVGHAPGRRELIVVQTQPGGMTCWDLETGKEFWHESFASPASFVQMSGFLQMSGGGDIFVTVDATGGLRVCDVRTGKGRASLRGAQYGNRNDITISPDGKTVATSSGGIFCSALSLWDSASGALLSDLPGHSSAITAVAFAPDGATVYTSGKDRTLRAWDPVTGLQRSRCAAEPPEQLAVSPDGTTVYTARPEAGSVRVLEPVTGRLVRELPLFKKSLIGFALTADGTRLIAAGRDGGADEGSCVRICDATTGALLREFSPSDSAIEQLAVRPDGEALVTSLVGQRVVLWNGIGKKLLERFGHGTRIAGFVKEESPYRIGSVALSTDGRWLAYSDQEQGIALVDARTGSEIGRAKPDVHYQVNAARPNVRDVLAFAPNNKTAAWSGVESTPDIFIIEARTARIRRRLAGDSYPVQHLEFSPNGSKLLSTGPDGSALIWDLQGRSANPPGKVPPAETVARWWDLLADEAAEDAWRAMQDMAAHPSVGVALLREKLKPVREIEPATLAAVLARLDGPKFEDREAASRELVALADAVGPYLHRVLQESPSLEVRRRIEVALDRIEAGCLRPERAVEVLELIGDADARQLLRDWAGGMRGAALTVDAGRAIARMTSVKGGDRGQ
jgi:RNA polymerase sigma factor (sigma-70 family)